jgi:hypothetical protein
MTRAQCLGLMIRDMTEGRLMQLFGPDGAERGWLKIEFVDVSDADKPVAYFEDGSTIAMTLAAPGGAP